MNDLTIRMIDNKNEQERAELHRTIWAIFHNLRGSVHTDCTDAKCVCRFVPNDEGTVNEYNLSVSASIEREDTREVIDISVLNAEIAEKRD